MEKRKVIRKLEQLAKSLKDTPEDATLQEKQAE